MFTIGLSERFTDSSSNNRRTFALLGVYVISLLFLTLHPAKRVLEIANNPLLILVILLPIVSIIWSINPELSGKRALAHTLTLIFILTVASRVTIEEFFRIFLIVLAATSVISILLVVAAPEIGVSQDGPNANSWRGGLGHKSKMGRICVLGLVVAIFFPVKHDILIKRLRWATILCFGVIIVGTDSRVAWMTLAIAILAAIAFKVIRWKTQDRIIRTIMFLSAFAMVAIPIIIFFEDAIITSGRDLTFSGRTTLWNSAIAVAQARHPISGAGYGAFWTESGSAYVWQYMLHWGHMPNHGHNGFLDAWLELGWIGLSTLVCVTLVSFFIIVKRINEPENGDFWFILLILHIVFLAINLAGTISFRHSEIFWICFLAPILFRHQTNIRKRIAINEQKTASTRLRFARPRSRNILSTRQRISGNIREARTRNRHVRRP